jgi:hypothetical protein
MPHYINVPVNENGIIYDPDMNRVVAEAIAVSPFGFDDVFIYSHGWSTDAMSMMNEYNRFSVDLAQRVLLLSRAGSPGFPNPPADAFGIGIHWPSEITEDPKSPLNDLQLFTFYTMEQRADVVGRNAVYSLLRLLLNARSTGPPLRLFLLGHSFGCKVICAALQDLQTDIANGTIDVAANTTFRAVLLEPATDDDNLQKDDIYGGISGIGNLRMLITHSQEDLALTQWFKLAGQLTNVFKKPTPALGDTGPTATTVSDFGGADYLSVTSQLVTADMFALKKPLVVADLTPVHSERKAKGEYSGGMSGSHSDINFDQIYYMVAGFLYS